jgi:colanic acid biosynthesis protein WcaH
MLPEEELLDVVEHAPLASIDLVVQNPHGEILLGLRTNEPAKGYWFVPGGRIRKDERLQSAFHRICNEELNLEYEIRDASFLGVFEHFYPTNFAGKDGVGTHYVVLAYRLVLRNEPENLPVVQHKKYEWMGEAMASFRNVHQNAKAYFQRVNRVYEFTNLDEFLEAQGYEKENQYEMVAARRNSHDTLLWQTPVLSLTAQAFLFTIALGSQTSSWARIASAILALVAAITSVHLFDRHRSFEIAGTKWLRGFEKRNKQKGYDNINARIEDYDLKPIFSKVLGTSSYRVWKGTLLIFAFSAFAIIVVAAMQLLGLPTYDFFGNESVSSMKNQIAPAAPPTAPGTAP